MSLNLSLLKILLGCGRHILNGSDLHYLLRIEVFSSAAVDWRSIGIQLGYPTSALDDIDQTIFNREGVRGCFCEMLYKHIILWLTYISNSIMLHNYM